MRVVLHLIALVAGVALVYQGFEEGIPAPPLDGRAWGTVAAFGFGVMLALVGLRYAWQRLFGDDAPLGQGAALVVVVLAGALTAGAVIGLGRDGSRECDAMVAHVRALVMARDPSMTTARFAEARPNILRRCAGLTSAQRRCSLRATSVEELQGCP